MNHLNGSCHCGNIKVAFETALDPQALPLRACQCAFCRRHGGVTTSDPAGRLVIEINDPELGRQVYSDARTTPRKGDNP